MDWEEDLNTNFGHGFHELKKIETRILGTNCTNFLIFHPP